MLGGCPDLSVEMAQPHSAQEFPQALEGGPGRGGSHAQLFGAGRRGDTPAPWVRGARPGELHPGSGSGGRAVTSSLGVPALAWSPFLM